MLKFVNRKKKCFVNHLLRTGCVGNRKIYENSNSMTDVKLECVTPWVPIYTKKNKIQ